MKNKWFLTGVILFIVIGGFVYMFITKDKRYSVSYELPEGFKGCAVIVYNVTGAPELKIKDQKLSYKFNQEGILYTSSPSDFGWEGKKSSGFRETSYTYVDKNGKAISEISIEDIIGHNTGSYQNDKFKIESFGVKMEDNESICFDKIDMIIKKVN